MKMISDSINSALKNINCLSIIIFALMNNTNAQSVLDYPINDTGLNMCFDTLIVIPCSQQGEPFFGQDAQYNGNQFSFQTNNDGTVTDLNTGLMWQQFLFEDKYSYEDALAAADSFSLGGFTDWRLPNIKEIYSLIDFRGITGLSAAQSTPYIDTNYFEFRYGDETVERFIDAQYASRTEYVGTTMTGAFTIFGVNFADGRIKGYGTMTPLGAAKLFEVKYVRGNTNYATNNFVDNGDGTVNDNATGLMWSKSDNGNGLNWEEALSWVYLKNQENYLGYNDWRLPNAKELQSIVDYTRSPQTTNSAAIDPIFDVTPIVDEGGETNYPFYWASTTHADGTPQSLYTKAVYVAFGEALGFMQMPPNSGNYVLMDVHGAGSQRSDPKQGDPNNFPHGFGPQGDVIRIYNYVRLVRDEVATEIKDLKGLLPNEFRLDQNYPNPFNPTTVIIYSVPTAGFVNLAVFNLIGEKVAQLVNKNVSAGNYRVSFDASDLTSGVYFYKIETSGFTRVKKMIVLK
jgi:hypothetical protein